MGGLIILLIGLAMTGVDCTVTEAETGTIEVWITNSVVEKEVSDDAAQFEIASIQATVSEIKVYTAVAAAEEEDKSGEWVKLYVARRPLDLLQESDQEQFLAFATVAATSYDQIIMVIDELNVILSNDSKITITFDEPFDLNASFVVYSGKTTTVIFRFNIDKSVTFTDDGQEIIKPLAGITLNVRYEEIE